MANGLPGPEKKYPDGFFRIDAFLPAQLSVPFEDFCRQHHLQKTDVIIMAINLVIKPEGDRQAELMRAAILYENQKKDLAAKDEEIASLKARLGKNSVKLRSFTADQIMRDIRDRCRMGKSNPTAIGIRCDELRPFINDKSVPEDQKAEIISFIESMTNETKVEGVA